MSDRAVVVIAGALGFYGLADTSADIARFLALIFVVALMVGRSVIGGPTVSIAWPGINPGPAHAGPAPSS